MARKSDRDDPLSAVRRLLRELRTLRSLEARRHLAMLGAVEIALFRLPPRQREIVRRYDLGGESAAVVQRALALSPRQFFRDRRQALAFLSEHLFDENPGAAEDRPAVADASPFAAGGEAVLAGKTFARSLAQSGNAECLDALRALARDASDLLERADLLLELAETANDYSDEPAGSAAVRAASHVLNDGEFAPAVADWLRGRLARAQAHLSLTPLESVSHFERAGAFLRRSIAAEPALLKPHSALADTLGDEALLQFRLGNFAQARSSSAEAVELIDAFRLANRPEALEISAVHVTIEAIVTGRTRAAVSEIAVLLQRGAESGWSSTASRLGAVLVGLNAVSGDYTEAIRRYRTMAPLALRGARPGDRSGLMMEAAHAYTMTGRPHDALSLMGYVRPGEGSWCPRAVVPGWHASAAAALDRLGEHEAALREAREALAGYSAQRTERGLGDAHRLMATAHAKLGDVGSAREHLREARRLAEHHATPYGLLLTLSAEAAILPSAALKREAAEYAKLLHELARS
jgi:tetratricopeptide (TPR) repeat protein